MIELKNIILSDKDPMLRKHSTDLDVNNIKPEEQYLIDMMVKYIDACYNDEAEKYGIEPGIALASNQVGLFKKVVYVHFKIKETEYKYLIANPKITAYSYAIGYLSDGEGCLSVKNKHEGVVPRHLRIIVKAYDLINKKEITIDASGMLSICLQHEIDHLSGILYYDHINKEDPMFTKPEWIKI